MGGFTGNLQEFRENLFQFATILFCDIFLKVFNEVRSLANGLLPASNMQLDHQFSLPHLNVSGVQPAMGSGEPGQLEGCKIYIIPFTLRPFIQRKKMSDTTFSLGSW